jgi:serine protease Do
MFRPKHATITVIAALFIGTGIGASVTSFNSQAAYNIAPVAQAQPTPVAPAVSNDAQTQMLRTIYAKVNPSVVSISVRVPASSSVVVPIDPRRSQPSQPGQQYQYGAGSGWVYDNRGHIVTNAHVVDNADQITVTFSDGAQFRARIVGVDADSDLAVIQVQGDAAQYAQYAPLTLADSDKVQVGEYAIAIGNPFERAGTLTLGIISATGRSVQGAVGNYVIPNAIQTDAAINPGNSGGPLLDANGNVIGVNQQIAAEVRQASGVAFAIPSNLVKVVADKLIADGKVEHSYLGIGGGTVTLDIIEAMNLPNTTRGAYISQVTAGSPAARAGLRAGTLSESNGSATLTGGDIITKVDDQIVRSFEDLTGYLYMRTEPGQVVRLTVLRDGKETVLSVTLGARPASR